MPACHCGDGAAECWKKWDRETNPKRWFVINVICLLFCMLELWLCLRPKISHGHRLAKKVYLVWDAFTCAIWVLEVGLPILLHGRVGVAGWIHRVELTAATYFFVTAIWVVFRWRPRIEHMKPILVDVTFSGLLYIFELYVVTRLIRRNEFQPISSGTDEETSALAVATPLSSQN